MNSFVQFGQLLFILAAAYTDAFSNVARCGQSIPASSTSLHVSSFSSDEMSPDGGDQQRERNRNEANSRHIEFADLGSIEQSSERKRRIQQEEEDKQRFLSYGDDLWNMRQFMGKLSRKLLKSINDGNREKEEELREELRQIEHQDPDLVYKIELEKLQKATIEGRDDDAMRHSIVASAARSNLPQYNLDGLWVGK
jgi:hypothetical protein